MNVESYRLFLQAVKLGSLTAAAEYCGYTQSAVSHIVASIEKEFGFPLLIRSKAGVRLTQDGERMLGYIRDVVSRDDILHQAASELKGLNAGRVRIGAFSSAAICFLPMLVREFGVLYPNIELDLRVDTYRTIEEWIVNDEIDCGFISAAAGGELELTPLFEDRLLAVLPKGNKTERLKALPIEKISDYDFIIPGEGTNYDIGRIFRSAGVDPKVSYAVSDDYAAIAMVKQGLGITIVPELILRGVGEKTRAVELYPSCTRTICLASLPHAAASPACRAFMSFAKERLTGFSAYGSNSPEGAANK